jgi:hypothetical protein
MQPVPGNDGERGTIRAQPASSSDPASFFSLIIPMLKRIPSSGTQVTHYRLKSARSVRYRTAIVYRKQRSFVIHRVISAR